MQINIQLRDLIILVLLGYIFFPFGKSEGHAGDSVGGPLPDIPVEVEEIPLEASSQELEWAGDASELLAGKEEILQSHFRNLEEELRAVERERDALLRAVVLAKKKGEHARGVSLEKHLQLLEGRRAEIAQAHERLLALAEDQGAYERELRASYREIKVSAPRFFAPRVLHVPKSSKTHALVWPVPPLEGVSAGYMDAAYRRRFGMDHAAIDIPVPQGTEILAPADGVVTEVHDRGYGYSTVVLEHADGLQTVFGHVSAIRVQEGQRVSRGETIALSGGRPGSRGSGLLTTGPHLHFEVHAYGLPIDPLYKLAPLREAIASAKASVMPAM